MRVFDPSNIQPQLINIFLSILNRYARWSLGFVDPPLEVSGRENRCTIKALNERGTVILPAVIQAMESLKVDGILKSVDIQTCSGDNADECGPEGTAIRVDVVVVPPADVGSFSEEDRSRQVSTYITQRAGFGLEKLCSIDMRVVFPPQDTYIFPTLFQSSCIDTANATYSLRSFQWFDR